MRLALRPAPACHGWLGGDYAREEFELKDDRNDDRNAVAAGGGALRASLTSNSSRAPLRQANHGEIRVRLRVSYVLSQDKGLRAACVRL
jgi:hypothetical protein